MLQHDHAMHGGFKMQNYVLIGVGVLTLSSGQIAKIYIVNAPRNRH